MIRGGEREDHDSGGSNVIETAGGTSGVMEDNGW